MEENCLPSRWGGGVCVRVCLCVYTHARVWVCVCLLACVYACVCVLACMHVRVCVCLCDAKDRTQYLTLIRKVLLLH